MIRILLVCVWVVSVGPLWADVSTPNVNTRFINGNQAYAEGNYPQAVRIYKSLIADHIYSGAVYYNLGNAYVRLGKKGYALLYYKRALRYLPHDEDIHANIRFITSQLDSVPTEYVDSWVEKIQVWLKTIQSAAGWWWTAYIGFVGACGGILMLMRCGKYGSKRKGWIIFGGFGLLFLLSILVYMMCYTVRYVMPRGMVIVPTASARYSPSFTGTLAFELTEGMSAQIIRTQGVWTHIRLNKKQSGWILSSAIDTI